jgi:hypothetical protein
MRSPPARLAALLLPFVLLVFASASAHAADLFAPSSFWNARLSPTTPVAADSPSLVRELHRQVGSAGTWINSSEYSTPVYTVGADQPTVRVTLDTTYPTLQADFAAVPLPADARPARGTDRHLTVYQPATDTLWEFWQARRTEDGWHARWGGKMTNVSRNPGHFPAPLGATGTSLPLLGGLIRIDELRAGRIDHALALAIPAPQADAFVWPAQRTDGVSRSRRAIPEGTRLRLDPRVDVARLGLPRAARAMAFAAQRYGIVVRDFSGAVTFYAEDPGTGPNPYRAMYGGRYPDTLLASFPWARLQVIAPPKRSSARPVAASTAPGRSGQRSSMGVRLRAPALAR